MSDLPSDLPAQPRQPPRPPLVTELIWQEELRFGAVVGAQSLVVDSQGVAGPSPMQLLAVGIASCMAIDVVSILQKGRHPLTGLRASLAGERLPEPPRRLVRVTLHFDVTGAVPEAALRRAIELSRTTYCSAWNSIRQDTELVTTFRLHGDH